MAKELFRSQLDTMDFNDTNYCVPVALALVTGVPAKQIDDSLKAKGWRKTGHGVYAMHWKQELSMMGFTATNVTKKYVPTGKVSVRKIADLLDPTRKFLVATQGHLLAVVKGQVEDWSAGRLHRVKQILEIAEDGIEVSSFVPKAPAANKSRGPHLEVFRTVCREIVNDGANWNGHFDSKVTGSWVKFSQSCGYSFLVGMAGEGKFRLALQEDKNWTRSFCKEAVAHMVRRPGQESKSYTSWILTKAEFITAVQAIRNV